MSERPILDIALSEKLLLMILKGVFPNDDKMQHLVKQKLTGVAFVYNDTEPEGGVVKLFFREDRPTLIDVVPASVMDEIITRDQAVS